MTDDRAAKKAEELLPCSGCRDSVYEILHEHTCPSGHRPAVAAELRKAYAEIERLNQERNDAMVAVAKRGLAYEEQLARLRAELAKVKP